MEFQPTKKLKVLSLVLLVAGTAAFLLNSYRASAQREGLNFMAEQKTRTMVANTNSGSPVEITLVKTQKREVETDTEFVDEDDWLQGLRIRLANKSGKTIVYIGLELIFWRTEDQPKGIPAAWPLRKGVDPFSIESGNSSSQPQIELALPGRDVEIAVSDAQYNDIRDFLKENEFPDSIRKVEIQITRIGFSDGTAWNGRMYRRDPKSIKGPIKGWVPVEDVGLKSPNRNLEGGARNRTAFFLDAAVDDSEEHWKPLPELSLATLDLNYKESKRTDKYGNRFRYRGKVKDTHGAQVGRWAWDVSLVSGP